MGETKYKMCVPVFCPVLVPPKSKMSLELGTIRITQGYLSGTFERSKLLNLHNVAVGNMRAAGGVPLRLKEDQEPLEVSNTFALL